MSRKPEQKGTVMKGNRSIKTTKPSPAASTVVALLSKKAKVAILLMVTALLAAALSLSACTTEVEYPYPTKKSAGLDVPEKDYEAVVVIVGNTANVPAPAVSKNMIPFFNAATLMPGFSEGTTFAIVSAAGVQSHSRIVMEAGGLDIPNPNGSERNNERHAEECIGAINTLLSVDPRTSHVDYLAAMEEGVRLLDGINGDKLMIIIGSGLNDCGDLNFASNTGLINEDPATITERILGNEDAHVSATTLKGFDIVLSGLGDTALPQPQLENEGTNSRINVQVIYERLISGMGGNIIYVDKSASTSGAVVNTDFIVNPFVFDLSVPLIWSKSEDESKLKTDYHLTEEVLTFLPDSASLKDLAAAKGVLRVVADDINPSQSARVSIVGYQAATSEQTYVETSELTVSRANAIRDLLVNELDVDPLKIVEVKGAGTGHFVEEFNEYGEWDTNIAAFNRVVVVSVSYE
jgi:hypothetical protein